MRKSYYRHMNGYGSHTYSLVNAQGRRVCIQVMTEEQAAQHPDNPFDLTKVWKHSEYPLIDVGTLELNRNPDGSNEKNNILEICRG